MFRAEHFNKNYSYKVTQKQIINYSIPDRKEDITLAKWQEYRQILTNPDLDATYKDKMAVKIFCDIPFNMIDLLKSNDYSEIIYHLTVVLEQKTEMKLRFTHKNIEYGLIPNFDKDITVAEKADLDMYFEAGDLIRLTSILYRPITFKKGGMYQIEPYSGTHELFADLPYDIAENVLDFFLSLLNELLNHTTLYLRKMTSKMKTNSALDSLQKKILLKNIEGMRL